MSLAIRRLLDLIADVETLHSPSHQPLMMACYAEMDNIETLLIRAEADDTFADKNADLLEVLT